MEQITIAVIMAIHNRKAKTLTCLQSLIACKPENVQLNIYICDDGSSDGSETAILSFEQSIKIIRGTGNWYWARSMYEARKFIMENFDELLWLNDDVILFENALELALQFRIQNPNSILIGQFVDPIRNEISYGGYMRRNSNPLSYTRVVAKSGPLSVDTFNGNFVLIPNFLETKLGSIDGRFSHAYADCDYGLRAKKLGVSNLVLPGYIGTCVGNDTDDSGSRLRNVVTWFSKKKSPIKSQIRFFRRHGSWYWPIFLFIPVIRILIKGK
ncbi:MAG: glycosyltransferase family 2 protein [Bacteroidetes bacterium]|nr:glycosyltransferase family 2 protein [bacterium]NBP66353.1 glycosyltransferase family 2 protein [Bacteroidota bacterium]